MRCVHTCAFHSHRTQDVQLFTGSPRSLEVQPAENDETILAAKATGFRKLMLHIGGFYSAESASMRAANLLYQECTAAADSASVHTALDLPHDFRAKHALLCLHVWLFLVRATPLPLRRCMFWEVGTALCPCIRQQWFRSLNGVFL